MTGIELQMFNSGIISFKLKMYFFSYLLLPQETSEIRDTLCIRANKVGFVWLLGVFCRTTFQEKLIY